ncbi:hypothetical protein BZA05DRAFT_426200 [Tricharina praecox]|uniref:uncharacterized protein n=1 Tax=Tricharina praecox TaxID=43433 RepID=UPI00221F7AE7|nr:uncharacterized protein BZA05DRAFT_426200 [Tricharina praecox]KAI5849125.1 hypothetical protein BZA05DRAFT_426200 [Tricharina praecox]
MAPVPAPEPHDDPLVHKTRLIEEILSTSDLYRVLGASRGSSNNDLRRHYLDRCKVVHPDKLPSHPLSTPAFQRLSHAYERLRTPTLRAQYDRTSPRRTPQSPSSIGVETTFRGAVLSILQEFLHGDFQLVRRLLGALGRQYPNLVNDEVVTSLERSFARMRELVLTTQTYALLLSIELGRLHRVQKRLMGLGYFDVVGRMRVGMQLVRVTLAIPVRVDRALRRKEEREWKAKQEGIEGRMEGEIGARLLNERVAKVLEFIVGSEVEDMPEDGPVRWGGGWNEGTRAA